MPCSSALKQKKISVTCLFKINKRHTLWCILFYTNLGVFLFFGGGGCSFVWRPLHLRYVYFISILLGKSHRSSLNIRSCVKTASVSAIFTLYFRTPLHSTAPDIQHTISYHMAPHMISYMLVSLSNRYNIEEFWRNYFDTIKMINIHEWIE